MPRSKELAAGKRRDITLKELRERLGGPGVTDEEFLLRYIMKGEEEIKAMRAAGPPKRYLNAGMPLVSLVQELSKAKRTRYVHIERGADWLTMERTGTTIFAYKGARNGDV